ncbi:MAG: translation initiation factor IF-2 [Deltaproteobacteria bacterium]|nr:translation initiation factor IF-2 [Deltaproteobacteria bacterium]
MSKKELLSRLNRPTGDSRTGWTPAARPAPTATPAATPAGDASEKRVSSGIIRRRARKEEAPEPAPAPVPAVETPRPTPTLARRRAAARPAAPPPEPVATEPVLAKEPPAEPSPPAEPVVEATPTEPAPVEVAIPEAPPEPEPPAPEPVVEVTAPPEPEAPETPPPQASAPAAAPTLQRDPSLPTTEERVRALPTLGDRRPAGGSAEGDAPRFTGLGKGVVKPPPGYDPNNPLDFRAQAKKAAEESVRATRGTGTEVPGWTGPVEVAPETEEDRREAPKGRPRRRERHAGRIEMLMDDMPAEVRRKRRTRKVGVHRASPPPKAQKRRIQVDGTISVANLAREMSLKVSQVEEVLERLGVSDAPSTGLDVETARQAAGAFEYDVVDVTFKEEAHMIQAETEAKEPRPPVITVMGHVDHGKTTLLDYIRKSKVAAGEAGGITQHLGAYQVEHDGKIITFIDTPGHAAFTEMRARGAKVTDIVILVVAADDGVMPQTIESIDHTRAAGVPIVVAVNKCDRKGVKPEAVRKRLTDVGLVPEEYGGDTLMVNVSAINGQGVSDLLDAVMLQAEMLELEAPSARHAEGTVLEARLEKGRGPVALVLVQKGTLKHGDSIVVGSSWGRVRAMTDFKGKPARKAGPSTPVEIMGLEEVPVAGDAFVVVEHDKAAKALTEFRRSRSREDAAVPRPKVTLEEMLARQQEDERRELGVVLKADVQGSVEALKRALNELKVEGVDLKVLHAGVGAVTESDVTLASTYGGIVIAFNVRPDPNGRRTAEQLNVEIRSYEIIYNLLDEIRAAMVGLLAPITEERFEGAAEVRNVFTITKVGVIAGCYVREGKITRNAIARVRRGERNVWEGRLGSLKRFKDDVREVLQGFECGIGLDGFNDVQVGDVIECHRNVQVAAEG